jgi:16S rRNA pseudouridine516 synthase
LDIGTAEEEELTRPGNLQILNAGEESEILLTIQEGKYHQVKRMFEAVGKEVVYLRRESMGTLMLDNNLKAGEYRPLTKEELEGVRGC